MTRLRFSVGISRELAGVRKKDPTEIPSSLDSACISVGTFCPIPASSWDMATLKSQNQVILTKKTQGSGHSWSENLLIGQKKTSHDSEKAHNLVTSMFCTWRLICTVMLIKCQGHLKTYLSIAFIDFVRTRYYSRTIDSLSHFNQGFAMA